MRNVIKPAATSAPTGDRSHSILPSSWHDVVTVIRMGLAFLFPWPFGTNGLKADVAARADLHHSSSGPTTGPGKPET